MADGRRRADSNSSFFVRSVAYIQLAHRSQLIGSSRRGFVGLVVDLLMEQR